MLRGPTVLIERHFLCSRWVLGHHLWLLTNNRLFLTQTPLEHHFSSKLHIYFENITFRDLLERFLSDILSNFHIVGSPPSVLKLISVNSFCSYPPQILESFRLKHAESNCCTVFMNPQTSCSTNHSLCFGKPYSTI